MALALFDRVQETTTTTGTGSVTLGGAVPGFQSFAVVGNGNTCYYTIVDSGAWEVGVGTYSTSGPTLARTTILSNSNGNVSPITLTAGTKSVFLTYPAGKSVNLNESGNVSPLGTVSSGVWQGTTVGVAYGGTGVTASSGANSVVLRDSDQNIAVNRVSQSNTNTTAAGGTTVLTAASSYIHTLVGTGGQTYTLPDATTLTTGVAFVFNNLATGTLTIANYAGTTIGTIPSGGAGASFLTLNSTVGGTWDLHAYLPEGVTFGTNAFNLGTSVISGGTWQGGTIATGYGGTGLTSYTSGGAVYANSSSTLTSGTLPVTAGGTGNTSGNATGLVDDSSWMKSRGSVATASIDTATANGFYTQNNVGDSQGLLVFNAGGSLGPLQMTFTYAGLFQFRNKTDSATWTAFKTVLTDINYNSYAPTLTGTGASGTWGINITGNAATATTAANYLPLAGGTLTGQLVIGAAGTAGSPTLRLNTSTSSAFVHTQESFAANLTSGQHIISVIGKVGNTKNSGYIGYTWAGDASNSNYVTIGHWGNDDLFRVYADGNVTVGTSTVLNASNYTSYAPSTTGTTSATFITAGNATWGGRLQIGGNGGASSLATVSVVQATDGNLHMDPGLSKATYLNYYNNGIIYLNGTTYYISSNGANYNGNAATATTAVTLTSTQSVWNTGVINNVVGMLAWKNYGNGHVIFDASASTSPSGGAVNNTNAGVAWSASYPTLMGWNGSSTYGVRVDSARVADSAGAVDYNALTNKTGGTGTYTTSGDYRAPIFYDSNDTSRYVDPNAATSAVFTGSVDARTYNYAGLLVNASGTASTGAAFGIQQVTAEGWTGLFVDYEPYTGWGLYHDNPNNYFCITAEASSGNIRSFTVPSRSSGNRTAYEKIRFDQNNGDIISGNISYAYGSSRAPIFYDYNDTTFYMDPASTSVVGAIRFTGGTGIQSRSVGTSYSQAVCVVEAPGGGSNTNSIYMPRLGWHWGGVVASSIGIEASGRIAVFNNPGTAYEAFIASITYGNDSSRAPIFYDSNDTAYYLDPNGTSVLNILDAPALNDSRLYLRTRGDTNHYLWNAGDDWEEMVMYFGTGFRVSNSNGTGASLTCFGSSNGNYVQAAGSMRAPLFYDSDNTAYYVDPAGTSQFRPGGAFANITDLGYTAPIQIGDTQIGTSATRYVPMISQTSLSPSGYRQHTVFGSVRATVWGSAFIAVGGNDSYPTVAFTFFYGGDFTAPGNVTAYSDERLKTNWRDMPDNFVVELAKIKVGIYDRPDLPTEPTQVGVGAQSLQTLLPQAVNKADDEMGTLSVSYGNAALASAVELAKYVTALEQRISQLEARL